MTKLFFIVVSMLVAKATFANLCTDTNLARFGIEAPGVYRLFECSGNAYRMLENYRNAGGDLSQSKVIIVLHELKRLPIGATMPVPVKPQKINRQDANGRTVPYHVFVEKDGFILDPDFELAPIPKQNYIDLMWSTGDAGALGRIEYISISAAEYAKVGDELKAAKGPELFAPPLYEHFKAQAGSAQYPKKKLSDGL